VRQLLEQQELAGERLALYARIGFGLLGLLTITAVSSAQTRITTAIWLGVIGAFCAYSAGVATLVRRGARYRPWLKYLSITIDTTLLYGIVLGSLYNHSGAYEAFRAPADWLPIATLNGLTALRYSRAASLYAGVLTLLLGGLVLLIAHLFFPVPWIDEARFVGEGLNLFDCVQDFMWAATPAFGAAVIARDSRRLIERAASEAAERTRLERENRAEQQLRLAQARLAEAEKLSALGRMLAQLSHEINNPINVIHNNVGPMREYLDVVDRMLAAYAAEEPKLPDGGAELRRLRESEDLDFVQKDLGKALDVVGRAADRIRGIHRDLSTFMRGAAALREPADLNELARGAVMLQRRGLPPGVEIVDDYGALPLVPVHAGQIQQVLANLLGNAADAVGQKGQLRIETRLRSDAVELAVGDSGPGVPEPLRARIWEPFFTTKDVGRGTGLGLAICRQIIEGHHGGRISLDVEHRPGARFVFTLPLIAAELGPSSPSLPPPADRAGTGGPE
jgi:signal transduction histidine kinase